MASSRRSESSSGSDPGGLRPDGTSVIVLLDVGSRCSECGDPARRMEAVPVHCSPRPRAILFTTATALLLGGAATSQATWALVRDVGRRSQHAVAYDSARQRTVLFGGNGPWSLADTWERE